MAERGSKKAEHALRVLLNLLTARFLKQGLKIERGVTT
jgi:hypothetical protein